MIVWITINCYKEWMSNRSQSSQYYKIDEQGNTIWFPYSFWGKGYILNDEIEEFVRQNRTAVSKRVEITFAVIFIALTALVLMWPSLQTISCVLLLVAAMFIYGRIHTKRRTASLEVSDMRLAFTDWLHPELMKNYEGNFGFCVVGIIIALLSLYGSVTSGIMNPKYRNLGVLWVAVSLCWGYLQFRACKYLMYIKHGNKSKTLELNDN